MARNKQQINMSQVKTFADIGNYLYDHPNVGLAMQFHDSRKQAGIEMSDEVNAQSLEKLRHAAANYHDRGSDPMMLLFSSMFSADSGGSGNAMADIEDFCNDLIRLWNNRS